MVPDERDEMIERLAAQLRPLPEVDPAARARLLVAVAAERERDRERERKSERRWGPARWSMLTVAAAAVVAAVLVGRERTTPAGSQTSLVPSAAGSAAGPRSITAATPTLASIRGDADASAPRPVQLVFRAPA